MKLIYDDLRLVNSSLDLIKQIKIELNTNELKRCLLIDDIRLSVGHFNGITGIKQSFECISVLTENHKMYIISSSNNLCKLLSDFIDTNKQYNYYVIFVKVSDLNKKLNLNYNYFKQIYNVEIYNQLQKKAKDSMKKINEMDKLNINFKLNFAKKRKLDNINDKNLNPKKKRKK